MREQINSYHELNKGCVHGSKCILWNRCLGAGPGLQQFLTSLGVGGVAICSVLHMHGLECSINVPLHGIVLGCD
jgi:hypothetical protein